MLHYITKYLIKNKKPLFSHNYNKFEHSVEIDGIKLFLDKHDSLGLHLQPYEPVLLKWVKEHVMSGDIVVDVGANIGYYTMMLAKAVGPKGKVFAFEPEPNNFELIKKNIDANGFTNIIPINSAVGKENGMLKLYISKPEWNGSNGMHRIYPSVFCEDSPIDISVLSLDTFFNNKKIWIDENDTLMLSDGLVNDISFVKIDAEGAELDVLKGMTNILNNKRLSMLVEYGPACVREKGDNPYETVDILKNANFNFNYESNNKIKRIKQLDKYVTFLNVSKITDININVANFLLEKRN